MIWSSLIAQTRRQLWMSLLVATFVAVVYFHFARFYQDGPSAWLFALGWVPVGLNWLRAGLSLIYRLDKQPFRVLEMGLEIDQVPPGKSFEIEIRVESRRDATLRRLAVELRCTRQKSTERGRQRSILESEERVLEEDLVMEPGTAKSYRVALPVPAGAPYSFRSMEAKIYWTLHVAVDVENWGELRDELEVMVAPG